MSGEQLKPLVDQLAGIVQKLDAAAPGLWESMVKRQQFDSTVAVALFIPLAVALVIGAVKVFRSRPKHEDLPFDIFVAGVLAFFAVFMLVFGVSALTGALFPEATLVHNLLRAGK